MSCYITNTPMHELEKDIREKYHAEDDINILITEKEIDALNRIVAGKLNDYYGPLTTRENPLYIIGLLTGCIQFMSDVSKYLTFDYTLHFLKVTSYHNQNQTPIDFSSEFLTKFQDKEHVLFMDELIDTGYSIKAVHTFIPSAKVCVLMSKQYKAADFYGIQQIPNLWLVGYGMDDKSLRRGWPFVSYKGTPALEAQSFRESILREIFK
ncbi:Hypoxanthine phosphoribosyltransferase [Spironucleus salmonicida]|uniref:Hypoxanthine phosphoribosyltransferase n=1 Tax=Spironucleus salmonicida TaxID=348837 RepID=V6LAC5_9EUKA|nr:Hypoxanthine phosphoribosyltransferase [Spironucleus salmonicida]|eukprot:EST41347.1 Hypoxanthine phosphoribosyltransferase [Spironucleus salmonicida]